MIGCDIQHIMIMERILKYIKYVTRPEKQVLSTQNTPIHIMVHISFSVCAIQIL